MGDGWAGNVYEHYIYLQSKGFWYAIKPFPNGVPFQSINVSHENLKQHLDSDKQEKLLLHNRKFREAIVVDSKEDIDSE